MKLFHRMILRALPGPFFGWLGTLMFLLLMQFLIRYLPDITGRGLPVTLIVRAAVSEERSIILDRIYDMSEAQFRRYWIAKVFRAEATEEPRIVLSNGEILELVGVIPGAVSIVAAADRLTRPVSTLASRK